MTHIGHPAQAFAWKEAVATAAAEGQAGLDSLKRQLASAARSQQGGEGPDAADTLDVAFSSQGQGLGAQLLGYASSSDQASSAGAAAAAGPVSGARPASVSPVLKRGLGLLGERKWMEALDYFLKLEEQAVEQMAGDGDADTVQGAASAASAGGPAAASAAAARSAASQARSYIELCAAKLEVQVPPAPAGQGAPRPLPKRGRLVQPPDMPGPDTAAPVPLHAVQHLALAVSASKPSKAAASAASAREQRAADARAVGQALAFLLHPDTASGAMPKALVEEATDLLRARAPGLTSPLPSALAPLGASGSGGGVPQAWKERAQKSKALAELIELVGLQAVKKQLFSMVDEVRGGGSGVGAST